MHSGADVAQICGFGNVSIDHDDDEHQDTAHQYVGELTNGVAARWVSALQNSGNLPARAAGLLLEGKVTTGGDPSYPVLEQTRDALVQLAEGTVDPAVYAMAMSMCDTYSGIELNDACQSISVQRWAQMDPTNAVPWLLLAGEARKRHSLGEEAEAFSNAAKSTKVDTYRDSLYGFAEPELPEDATPLERSYLATEVSGVEAGMSTPQYLAVDQHCSVGALQDRKVRQECNAVAQLLAFRGGDLLDLSMGRIIGARVGWPSDRVNELLQQRNALMQVIRQATPSDNSIRWTCEGVSQVNAYMDQRARLGEVGAANELLQRSGETVLELAAKYTQFVDDTLRNAKRQEQDNSGARAQ
jgi:hypothetical protein